MPIWKDGLGYPESVSMNPWPNYIDYTLRKGGQAGEIVYTGRAYKRPGEAVNIPPLFSVNDIVANFLKNEFPRLDEAIADPGVAKKYTTDALQQFTVEVPLSISPDPFYSSVWFLNDYSYRERGNPAGTTPPTYTNGLPSFQSAILVEVWDRRLPVIRSYIDGTAGTGYTYVNEVLKLTANVTSAPFFFPTEWPVDGRGYDRHPISIPAGDTCYRYALYFLNAFGGWSVIYLEAVKERDKYDRKTAKRAYFTGLPRSSAGSVAMYTPPNLLARGTVNYANEVTKGWDAKTPYLTDELAAKIWHLVGTTDAYLYDMETGVLSPVNVDNTSWEAQTYRNQGIKRPRYDINLTLAQDRLRR